MDVRTSEVHVSIPHEGQGKAKDCDNGRTMIGENVKRQIIAECGCDLLSLLR